MAIRQQSHPPGQYEAEMQTALSGLCVECNDEPTNLRSIATLQKCNESRTLAQAEMHEQRLLAPGAKEEQTVISVMESAPDTLS